MQWTISEIQQYKKGTKRDISYIFDTVKEKISNNPEADKMKCLFVQL